MAVLSNTIGAPALGAFLSKLPNLVLAAVALGLAAIALTVDATYYGAMGHDPVLAALGLAIDLLSITLPAVACRAPGLVPKLTGWGIWAAATGMTLLATAGWSSQNIGDFVQGRSIEATRTDDLLERLQALRGQRKAIGETRSVHVIEASLKVHCDRACKRDLGIAKAAAEQRDELDGRIAELSGRLSTAKPIAAADSGAAIVAAWLHVAPGQVAGARLFGLTCLPATAGVLLSLAVCGAPWRQKQEVEPCSPTIGHCESPITAKAIASTSTPQPTPGRAEVATAPLSVPLAPMTASFTSEPTAAESGGSFPSHPSSEDEAFTSEPVLTDHERKARKRKRGRAACLSTSST
jgi:hypothetical protein